MVSPLICEVSTYVHILSNTSLADHRSFHLSALYPPVLCGQAANTVYPPVLPTVYPPAANTVYPPVLCGQAANTGPPPPLAPSPQAHHHHRRQSWHLPSRCPYPLPEAADLAAGMQGWQGKPQTETQIDLPLL
jgi:hypothetical protein